MFQNLYSSRLVVKEAWCVTNAHNLVLSPRRVKGGIQGWPEKLTNCHSVLAESLMHTSAGYFRAFCYRVLQSFALTSLTGALSCRGNRKFFFPPWHQDKTGAHANYTLLITAQSATFNSSTIDFQAILSRIWGANDRRICPSMRLQQGHIIFLTVRLTWICL
jgi:hypothetical protein